jgi:hypothetical protein
MIKGCTGCLGGLLLLALTALMVGGAVGAAVRMLKPPAVAPPASTAADGSRAQQKLFEVARGARIVTLSESEINALLAHHLIEARGVRLAGLAVHLVGADRVEVVARVPLAQLLDEMGIPVVTGVLPRRWAAHPVWLRAGAQVRVERGSRPRLRLDVDDFAVGRQRLPARSLRLLLDPATVGLLQWPLPGHVESIAIEPGRVVIRGAASP